MMNVSSITLRPVTLADEPFLRRLYGTTRYEELAPLGWTTDQQVAFLAQQFNAQSQHYRTTYPEADLQVICAGAEPIGRLYVARRPDEILLIDIALLPLACNRGIGSKLLRSLNDEAAAAEKPVRLHVQKGNPAQRLYTRLGFCVNADHGVYWSMERPSVAKTFLTAARSQNAVS
ncbi:MAG: hypothetical protein NVSMB42_11610 [Herpetosiphon sp.]